MIAMWSTHRFHTRYVRGW